MQTISDVDLKDFLNQKVEQYQQRSFIEYDPISIPHRYSKKQDIEIAAFIAATLAWGQRKTIIKKCLHLLECMDDAPCDFILHHNLKDLLVFKNFSHRTFNFLDLTYFFSFLQQQYQNDDTLETLFLVTATEKNIEKGLVNFHNVFTSPPNFQNRTAKHVASPQKKSACKRLNMFLRWMVRKQSEVDFGIWQQILPSQLICPCDVHVARIAQKLKLISPQPTSWKMAIALTAKLQLYDFLDPVKYDFALFGLGVEEKF